jgi:hypothetical protein
MVILNIYSTCWLIKSVFYKRQQGITGGLRYSGYYTLIVALEPSVEWVAGAGHSTVAKIGTPMLLWVPTQDLVVRSWG